MTTLSTLAGLGLMSLSGTVSAAALTCITGENAVTVNSSSACAVTPGQNDEQVDENGLIFNPGGLGPYSWTFLDKDNRSNDTILDNENNQIAGALGDVGVEIVHQHAEGGFLLPSLAADLGPSGGADHALCGARHRSSGSGSSEI